MVKKITWTLRAIKNYDSIYDYLLLEWSYKIADDFKNKLNRQLSVLKQYPLAGLKSNKRPGFMKFVLNEYNTLYYRIKKQELIVMHIRDNRQNPDKFKF